MSRSHRAGRGHVKPAHHYVKATRTGRWTALARKVRVWGEKEAVMAADKTLSWSFTEDYPSEPSAAQLARAHAAELGVDAVSPATGALFRLLAAAVGARSVVEVGTGTGVSGVWLLGGMAPDGVLTSIDIEPEYQRVARESFASAGARPARTRLIAGRALDVLPRLADRAYDMVVIDGDPAETAEAVDEAFRLLREGGLLVINDALARGQVADPARRDPLTVSKRGVVKELREREDAVVTLLPTGDGVIAALKVR